MTRQTVLLVLGAWLMAAGLLYWLAPGLGATYLVASGWIAAGMAAAWALTRWPPFKRTLTRRGRPPGEPGDPTPRP